MRRLQEYRWPGNIRQLQNAIEQSAVLCDRRSLYRMVARYQLGSSTHHRGAGMWGTLGGSAGGIDVKA